MNFVNIFYFFFMILIYKINKLLFHIINRIFLFNRVPTNANYELLFKSFFYYILHNLSICSFKSFVLFTSLKLLKLPIKCSYIIYLSFIELSY